MKVMITGADQGIGRATMDYYINKGHDVIPIAGSVIDPERGGSEKFLRSAISRNARPDILINNYGINRLGWIGKNWVPRMGQLMDVNVNSYYAAIDELAKNDMSGIRVLNIASITYRVPQRCSALYCASKAAVVQLTKVMARELAPSGWVINCLSPGKVVGTEMTNKVDEQVMELRGWNSESADEYAMSLIPMHRFTTTDEVSEAIYKINELPEYINGACIDMAGGV